MPHPTHPASTATELVVPSALLLDDRLMPLERNAWLALRSLLSEDGTTALVTYETLRQYLPCTPGRTKASLETVSRTITILRLTGWISLVEYRRNALAGFVLSSRYAVLTEPKSFVEACHTDASYLDLLERSLRHANQAIRQVAQVITSGAVRDPLTAKTLPQPSWLRLQQLSTLVGRDHRNDDDPPDGDLPSDRPAPPEAPANPKAADDEPYVRTSSTNKEYLKVRTYRACAREQHGAFHDSLQFPARFAQLLPAQQRDVISRLQRIKPAERQAVLNEWDVRCALGYVRDAAAYLFGIIKKALTGMFQLWAARKTASDRMARQAPASNIQAKPAPAACGDAPSSPAPAMRTSKATAPLGSSRPSAAMMPPSRPPAPREVALAHIARLKEMLGRPRHAGDLAQQLLARGTIGAG